MPFTENLPRDDRQGEQSGRVVVVCGDLFFGTQLTGVVRDAGFEPVPELSLARAQGHFGDSSVIGVVIDLETPGLDIAALMSGLPAVDKPRVVAFGPHVHERLLNAARDAGCDAVLTRGQITASPSNLRKALTELPEPPEQTESPSA